MKKYKLIKKISGLKAKKGDIFEERIYPFIKDTLFFAGNANESYYVRESYIKEYSDFFKPL
mgnify:CR=1 FL=1